MFQHAAVGNLKVIGDDYYFSIRAWMKWQNWAGSDVTVWIPVLPEVNIQKYRLG